MLADSVKPHSLGEHNIAPQGLVAGGGKPSIRPIALVENHHQWKGSPVQNEAVALNPERAERGVAFHMVDQVAIFGLKLQLGADQCRSGRTPEKLVSIIIDSGVR